MKQKLLSGQEKLREVENPRIVFEEDGTLVDDEDYFCTLPDDTIVQLLGEGEIWRSCKTDVPMEKTDSASSAALENQEVTMDELCQDLKEDLARIITFSRDQLQDLVDADAPTLARKLEESEKFVKKLQSACQRFIDERDEAKETADLVRLYDEAASKANKSIEENPKRPTRPFKVWNLDRSKKYAVMASSLQTLIQK
ncbi:DNAation factor subunit alpha, partial [Plakobranchus ocellatus]